MWRIKKKIGIIGFGNMGSAIAQRIKAKYKVFIFDKDKEKTKNLKDIKVTDTLVSLVEQSDVVILAVKPQDYDVVLHELKGIVKNKLIISIAAGIPTELIEKVLGNIRVIRAMPNLPARVGNGITYLCKGHFTRARDLRFAQLLFKNMGTTFIALEDIMSEVTAASGSGPGFWCHEVSGIPKDQWKEYTEATFIPLYSTAIESLGFKEKEARRISELVGRGSLLTVESWNISPSELESQVASKGGTTEAGLKVLRNGGSLVEAVEAAAKRAKELSKG